MESYCSGIDSSITYVEFQRVGHSCFNILDNLCCNLLCLKWRTKLLHPVNSAWKSELSAEMMSFTTRFRQRAKHDKRQHSPRKAATIISCVICYHGYLHIASKVDHNCFHDITRNFGSLLFIHCTAPVFSTHDCKFISASN